MPELPKDWEDDIIPPINQQAFFKDLDRQIHSIRDEELKGCATAFRHSLFAIIAASSTPLNLVADGIIEREATRIADAARKAEALAIRREGKAISETDGAARLQERALSMLPELKPILVDSIMGAMRSWIAETPAALTELTHQSSVSCWSALEVLAKDVFVTLLNRDTKLIALLRQSQEASKILELTRDVRINLDELERENWNLSKLGSLLMRRRNFDRAEEIRIVFAALCPEDSQIISDLSKPELRQLNCRRHLLVHRGGRADIAHVSVAGDGLKLGEQLRIKPRELTSYLVSVNSAGNSILRAANLILNDNPTT